MSASKTLDKAWLVFTASLFLWIRTAIGSPEAFHQETPMSKLANPVDFTQLVHVESTETAEVSFWSGFDKASGGSREFRIVDVNPRDNKVSWEIKCDFQQQTATVKSNSTDASGKPVESLLAYKMTKLDSKNVCLMRLVSITGGVDVITMSADIGAFTQTIAAAPGFIQYQGTLIWYGFCRN